MDTQPPVRAVHCCACNRLITLRPEQGAGSELVCPFCHSRQKLRQMSVLVSDPLLPA